MTFILVGLGNVSILHTWRNLANLKVAVHRAKPVFAGENAVFELTVNEESNRARYSIFATFYTSATFAGGKEEHEPDVQDIAAMSESTFRLSVRSQKRGWLPAPRVTFSTEFPVSLFHVWAYAATDGLCMVYPNPSLRNQTPISQDSDGASNQLSTSQGDDDFAGHRIYQQGDSPKRIDWKASSREQGLLVKQFQAAASNSLWFDFNDTTGENIELRISQLTRWVVDAENQHLKYGLRLPKKSITPNTGNHHYHQCLTALALM